jgi:hypothetical protein
MEVNGQLHAVVALLQAKELPIADSIEGCVVSRAGLDALVGIITGPPARNRTTVPQVSSPQAGHHTDLFVSAQGRPQVRSGGRTAVGAKILVGRWRRRWNK